MAKDSLEKFFMKLYRNLFEELVFYIPGHLMPDELLIEHNLLELQKYFQMVIYMDKMKGPVLLEESDNRPNMISKGTFLEKNIFILLKKRDKESKATFHFILEKYVKQIQGYCFVSQWMTDNIEATEVKGLNREVINTFNEQSKCYSIHLADLKRYFQNDEFIVISEPNGAINTIEGYVPKLMRQLESMEEKLDKKTKLIDSFVKGVTSEMARSPKVALKKKLLMSEIEADEFILKTVFNLTVVKEDE
jgi:hypothetical protein